MTSLTDVLQAARAARRWSVPEFARRCEVSSQLAYKWLSDNPHYRVVPGPASCEKIADALDLDLDYVLELAGHRKARERVAIKPPLSLQQLHIDQEYDRWMDIMAPRLGHDAAHNAFWDPVVADARARRETLESALKPRPADLPVMTKVHDEQPMEV